MRGDHLELATAPRAGDRWWVRSAAHVGHDRLLVTGSFPGLRDGDQIVVGAQSRRQAATARRWTGTDVTVLVVVAPERLPFEEWTISTTDSELAQRVTVRLDDVRSVLRGGLAALPAHERSELLAFIVEACATPRDEMPRGLSESLHLVRDVLRQPMSRGALDPHAVRGLHIELVAAVDQRQYYVRGWIGHATEAVRSVVAVSPEGARCDVTGQLFRYRRDDVAHFYGEEEDRVGYGFAAHFHIDVPSVASSGWVLEVMLDEHHGVEAMSGTVVSGIDAVRNAIVGDLVLAKDHDETLRRDHISPAVTSLLERSHERVEIRRVVQLGQAPSEPVVSIIVPLYQRIDFLEHQLIQFAQDPEVAAADLIYVLDSPELAEALEAEAQRLFRMYRVPFRVVLLSHNGGFSTANNMGASVAHGRLLLLMNSDVLPDAPGWVSAMVNFYDRTSGIGALGPKLIYEDESIQHAGMFFERPYGATSWGNEHYFKGLHRSFPAACVSRRVPAVTAACMMISAELYRAVGGLRGTYVQGDFEDSDLCLRLSEAGFDHWYLADVELYHLEGQSYPSWQRVANGQFNRWLHTELWDEQITKVMALEASA